MFNIDVFALHVNSSMLDSWSKSEPELVKTLIPTVLLLDLPFWSAARVELRESSRQLHGNLRQCGRKRRKGLEINNILEPAVEIFPLMNYFWAVAHKFKSQSYSLYRGSQLFCPILEHSSHACLVKFTRTHPPPSPTCPDELNLFDRCGDWFVGKLPQKHNKKPQNALLSLSDEAGNFLPIFFAMNRKLFMVRNFCGKIVFLSLHWMRISFGYCQRDSQSFSLLVVQLNGCSLQTRGRETLEVVLTQTRVSQWCRACSRRKRLRSSNQRLHCQIVFKIVSHQTNLGR